MQEIDIPKSLFRSQRILFLAGSYVEGFNTKTSDIDIYEICTNENEKANRIWDYRKIQDIYENGFHYEIELINEETIKCIYKKLDYSINNQDSQGFILSFNEYQIIWDVLIGVPISNESGLEKYKVVFSEKINEISTLLVNQNGLFVQNTYEDILGLIQANDFYSGYFRSLDLLQRTADLLIAYKKILNTKSKWRYKKLEQAGLIDFQRKYISFFLAQVSDFEEFIKEIVLFCSNEISKVDLHKDKYQWIDIEKFNG